MTGPPDPVILAEGTRGTIVESRHLGHVAVVDADGALVFSLGDPDVPVFLRSSAKPVQALPALVAGAADAFGFTPVEIALACGSHEGEPLHVETARGMLAKAGLEPDALRCGIIPPMDEGEADRLTREGVEPSPLHNECSGEHAAMVTLAHHLGADLATYTAPDHPVQQRVREAVARFTGVPPEHIVEAGDGCGIPTFAVPLRNAALLAVRLVAPPADWDEPTRAACDRLTQSMTAHPEMVDGTDHEALLDSALMLAGDGRLVSKMGAEGLVIVGVRPCEAWPRGLGVAVAVCDGDPEERARPPITVGLLHRLGVMTDADVERLASHARKPIKDNLGEEVGEVRPSAAITES